MISQQNKGRASAAAQQTRCSPSNRSDRRHSRAARFFFNLQLRQTILNFNRMAAAARSLPDELPRPRGPTVNWINPANIEAVAPASAATPPRILREQLLAQSPALCAGLQSLNLPSNVSASSRTEITVPANDFTFRNSFCPTHVLAVMNAQDNSTVLPKVFLFPIHTLVFAASCSFFPVLPSSAAATPEGLEGPTTTIPISAINVPSPSTFGIILKFVYTKDTNALYRALLPRGWDSSSAHIMQAAMTIQGVYQNAMGLGLVDERLISTEDGPMPSIYDVIEESWTRVKLAIRQRMPVQPEPVVSS